MNKEKVTIIAPVLNEVTGVRTILPMVNKDWYDQLIVLDGKSTDGTIEWCRDNYYEVFVQHKDGLWNAYYELFKSNIVIGDVIVLFSPDGNSIPWLIPELCKKISDGYDMVIAARYKDRAKSYDDTKLTRIGNFILNQTINLVTGYKYRYIDSMVMMRAFKKELVYELNMLNDVTSMYKFLQRYSSMTSWEPALSIRCSNHNFKIAEIAGDEPPRTNGGRRQSPIKQGAMLATQILYEGFKRF